MSVTVLIVEDCETAAAALQIALTAMGLEVLLVADASEALRILAFGADRISALITDIHLPKMDGFELIRRVRGDSRYFNLPIVVVSGDSHPETPRRLYRLGANAHFTKPYSPAEIRIKLEALLHVHKSNSGRLPVE